MHFFGLQTRGLREGEEREGEEEEREEEEEGDQAKVLMLDYGMNFCIEFSSLCEGPCHCMVMSLP